MKLTGAGSAVCASFKSGVERWSFIAAPNTGKLFATKLEICIFIR
jgi:hypothetical protein